MRTTLFHIPNEIAGIPVFGVGILLAVWVAICLAGLAVITRRRGGAAELLGYLPVALVVAATIVFFLPMLAGGDGLPIRGYGVMVLVGILSGVWLAAWQARRMGIDPEIMYSLAFWQTVVGFVTARIFYVASRWEHYRDEPISKLFKLTEGGLVVYGGAIGLGIATLVFLYRRRIPMLAMFDLIAPSWMLALALGRVGCFLNGCCWGGECELPWSVRFPAGSPPWSRQLQEGEPLGIRLRGEEDGPARVQAVFPDSAASAAGVRAGDTIARIDGREVPRLGLAQELLSAALRSGSSLVVEFERSESNSSASVDNGAQDASARTSDGAARTTVQLAWPKQPPPDRSRPVHPVQLYATVNAALLCALLVVYYPFRRRDGEVGALMLTLYPLFRLVEEAIRSDEPLIGLTRMTISQNISVGILAFAIGLWAYLLTRPRGSVLPILASAGGSAPVV